MLANLICKQLHDITCDGEQYVNVMYKATAYVVSSQGTNLLLRRYFFCY